MSEAVRSASSTTWSRRVPARAVFQSVPVDVVLRRQDGGFLGRVRVHVKDTCFRVIDPGDGMRGHQGMF